MVPLTFVERLLCGKDTNCEEWGQLAMIGRSCIGRGEAGQEPRRLQVQLEKACTHKTSQAFPTRQSSRPEARTAATKTKETVCCDRGPWDWMA